MKAQRPYLLRAMYDWISDSGETPHLLVDASVEGVVVPQDYVEDGQIVLNIGVNAIRDLQLGEEFVMFSSRFNGRAMELVLPMASIKAIYCKDSGEGMAFPVETLGGVDAAKADEAPGVDSSALEDNPSEASRSDQSDAKPSSGKPTLKLV